VLAFGALGWVMARLGWPRPPLLLGLVRGPLAENRLFLSTDNYGTAWLLRPGVLIIAAVIAARLVIPIVNKRRAPAEPARRPAVTTASGRRIDGATAFNAALVLVFAVALWLSRGFDVRAGLFPWTITAAALILAIIHAASELGARRHDVGGRAHAVERDGAGGETRKTAAICGWIFRMYVALWLLGFSLATLVTSLPYLRAARERWPISMGLSLGRVFVWLGYGG
jgi:putative tricarboxylic transport membrane protein